MVSEAHCMSFPCAELLLFNYAKVKTIFHSMAPLKIWCYIAPKWFPYDYEPRTTFSAI